VNLQRIYKKYKHKADFVWVYVKEAHPTGSRRPAKHVEIPQPETLDERKDVANKCSGEIKLAMPMVVDDMSNNVATAYNALPDRLFILGADGRIAYRGDRGPRGFSVDGMEQALLKLIE
jgi:hypothetical protein